MSSKFVSPLKSVMFSFIPPMKSQACYSNSELPFPRRFSKKFGSKAFTLVEVTLAIGIISFAFVAMFGLLPVGLNVSRQAIDTTIEAQIAQKLTSQALQTDFSMLKSLSDAEATFFDDQGKPTTAERAIYKTKFAVETTTSLPSGVSTDKLATVSVHVLNTKGNPAKVQANPVSDPDSKKFNLLIPDNGL